MKLTIQSLHFTAKSELTNFVTEKVNKLSHFYDKIESANVSLKLEKSDTTNNKICEIRLSVPGNDLFVKRQCKTFEEATNESVHILHQQIEKMKAKLMGT
jgi:putative sigma-54 modulation protein